MSFWDDLVTVVTNPANLFLGLTNAGCPPDMLPYKAPGEKVRCVPGPGYEVSKRTKLEPVKIRDWTGTQGPDVLQTAKQYWGIPEFCPLFHKRDSESQECVINWNSVLIAGAVLVGGAVALRVIVKK